MTFESWGRYPRGEQKEVFFDWRDRPYPSHGSCESTFLPVGQGRSYGDSCLNFGGTVIHTRNLNRLMNFDVDSGVLTCEGGVTLAQILEFAVPRGWFLPVTPGTKFVSVAGAIANDVHGKNHHVHGTFGRFVNRFGLIRSDNSRLICSPTENPELYQATISGLGLTGIIVWAEIQLKAIRSSLIEMESIKFQSLSEFFEISRALTPRYEYSVSWLDCVSSGENFGRGIFMAGNHASEGELVVKKGSLLTVPIEAPQFVLGAPIMKLFNTLYYHRQFQKRVFVNASYDPFFYPLDAINGWNKLYGKNGFFQFQCVLQKDRVSDLLKVIVDSEGGSFLAVLKEFGEVQSPGMMSFPRPGVTLALDFANKGSVTHRFLERLDGFVAEAGGAIYPAKDAAMSGMHFQQYYPRWQEFAQHVDPKHSSTFWRRVTGKNT